MPTDINKPVWPVWQPGLELKSSHLFALEDYLIERFRLMGQSYGVVDFNYKTSITFNEDNGVYSLIAKRIQGVTQGGYPVRFDQLSLKFSLEENIDFDFDLWVEIKVEDDYTDNQHEDNEKQQLQLSTEEQFSHYSQKPNWLYLGRYQINDDPLFPREKPIPLFLAAIKPHDDTWDDWCNPLVEKIQAFCEHLEYLAVRNIYAQVAFKELVSLSIEWPVVPIIQLAHRLVRIERMIRLIEDSNFDSIDTIKEDCWPPDNSYPVRSSEIPDMLASLLGELPVNSCVLDLTGETVKTTQGEQVFIEAKLEYELNNQYRVKLFNGSVMAMNWYSPEYAEEVKLRIQSLINRNPGIHFLWPQAITYTKSSAGMGYIKPMLSENKIKFDDFIINQPLKFHITATIALNLVLRFQALHSQELAVSKMDASCLYVDVISNEVEFSYEENIVIEGNGALTGNPEFVPSLDYSRHSIHQPGSYADRYFLAVLLFKLFMKGSPLIGKSETGSSDFNLEPTSPTEPVFVFDTSDRSNELNSHEQKKMIKYWDELPKTLKDKFMSSFTFDSSNMKYDRISEHEWIEVLSQLRDHVIYCSKCDTLNLYDRKELDSSGGKPSNCWQCKEVLVLPPRLRFGDRIILLNLGTQIYPYHIEQRPFDFSSPIGRVEIVEKSENPHRLVLRNLSKINWIILLKNNETKEVAPEHRMILHRPLQIKLGEVHGETRIQSDKASW